MEARKPGDMLPYGANLIDTGQGRYEDTGCREDDYAPRFPSCLHCPLDRCRYDDPGALRKWLKQQQGMEVVRVVLEGGSIEEAADKYGVTTRTIWRTLKRLGYCIRGHRKEGANVQLYTAANGIQYGRCRECDRENQKKLYHERKKKE